MQVEIKNAVSRFVDLLSMKGSLVKGLHGEDNRVFFVGNNRLLVKIIVNKKPIIYYVEADDKLITPWFVANGRYDTAPTKFFVDNLENDSHCIDVGSNFGYFATLMGCFAPHGKVIAIEADERIASLARDNVIVNNLTDIAQVIHAAISSSNDDVVLFRRVGRSGNTSISHCGEHFTTFLGEPAEQEFRVRGVRIDDLLDSLGGRVDFMKIDVEGAEPLAFAGAGTTIATNPQIQIVMEWSPGQIRAAGFDIPTFLADLNRMGLRPFKIRKRGTSPLSFDEVVNLPYESGLLFKR